MAINSDVDIPVVLNYLNKKPEILALSQSSPPHTITEWTCINGGDGKPTDEEINKAWTDYQASQAVIAYQSTRKGLDSEPGDPIEDPRTAQYPDIGDQLDDLYKQGAFSADMSAKIKKVKDDNPKP